MTRVVKQEVHVEGERRTCVAVGGVVPSRVFPPPVLTGSRHAGLAVDSPSADRQQASTDYRPYTQAEHTGSLFRPVVGRSQPKPGLARGSDFSQERRQAQDKSRMNMNN
ncbi:hypothetical protein Bbelb_308230 [Branchiostoma belcheri]|nr:hypothetical protein Bbelb_308230 [Branchiostoma belcheri]